MMTIRSAPLLLATLTVALSGCASSPNYSLQGLRLEAANKLAVRCYAHHEGERLVFGPAQVFSACRQWAHQQVQVRFPQ